MERLRDYPRLEVLSFWPCGLVLALAALGGCRTSLAPAPESPRDVLQGRTFDAEGDELLHQFTFAVDGTYVLQFVASPLALHNSRWHGTYMLSKNELLLTPDITPDKKQRFSVEQGPSGRILLRPGAGNETLYASALVWKPNADSK